jgi:hypothetical protein
MKTAFVQEKYGIFTISISREAHPIAQLIVDLGIPNFSIFSMTVPIEPDDKAQTTVIIMRAFEVLVEQIKVFLGENEFESDGGIIDSLITSIDEAKLNIELSGPSFMYEVPFAVGNEFHSAVAERFCGRAKFAGKPENLFEKYRKEIKDERPIDDARKVINRYKNNLYKTNPGPMYIMMYDRFGKPSGVARMTNRGLVNILNKKAVEWTDYIRGEYWLDSDCSSNIVDCGGDGDYNHVSYASENILGGKWDEIVGAIRDRLDQFKSLPPQEVEDETGESVVELENEFEELLKENPDGPSNDFIYLTLWNWVDNSTKNMIFDNDYALFEQDLRNFYMKHYHMIRVVNRQFEVWKLSSREISAILDFIFDMAQMDDSTGDLGDDEVFIEEISTSRYVGVPLKVLLETKQPGQLWRYKNMVVSKQAAPQPTEKIQQREYWHGTPQLKFAERIIAEGIRPSDEVHVDLYKSFPEVKPQKGRVYVGDFETALTYSKGGSEVAGSPEDYRYMFKINGSEIVNDVQPDEDIIGFLAYAITEPEMLQDSGFWPDFMDQYDTSSVPPEYEEFIQTHFTKHDVPYHMNPGWDDFAHLGNKILPTLPDSIKIKLIEYYGLAIAHLGTLRPCEGWKYSVEDEEKVSTYFDLRKYGTRIL